MKERKIKQNNNKVKERKTGERKKTSTERNSEITASFKCKI